MYELIFALDSDILLFVQDTLRTPVLNTVFSLLTRLGDAGLVWIALGVILLLFRRTRRGGLCMLGGLACEYVICDLIIKPLVMRTRPYLMVEGLELIIAPQSSFSFPSGHAASSFVCAYLLTRAFGKKGAWAYLPAALIALSRIYVGVHYPSDVLAGMLLGTVVGVLVWRIVRRMETHRCGDK